MFKKLPTALEFLRSKHASKDLMDPESPLQEKARTLFLQVTPRNLVNVVFNFSQPRVLRLLSHFNFYSGHSDWEMREQLQMSSDWTTLKPGDLLFLEAPAFGSGDKIINDAQIATDVRGLLSRKDRAYDENFRYSAFFPLLLRISGIDLRSHIKDLLFLKEMCPSAFARISEDRLDVALKIASYGNFPDQLSLRLYNTIFRHWLLHRASYLQLTAAFIVSLSNTQTHRFFRRFLRRGDVSATAAMQWVNSFGASSEASLTGYHKYVTTGADAGSPGVKPLQQRWLHSTLEKMWSALALEKKLEYHAALAVEAPKLVSHIDAIVALPPQRIADTLAEVRKLHAAAGIVETDDSRRVSLFTMWTGGISQTTMLLGYTIRYLQAVQLTKRYIGNLDRIKKDTAEIKSVRIRTCDIVAVADEMASHLMGDWAPSLMNTDKSIKLARAFADTLPDPGKDPDLPADLVAMRKILDPFWNLDGRKFSFS